jgi:hypothetical protein
MNQASRIHKRLRRTFTWYLSGKIVLALFILAVSATSLVTSTIYQAEIGGALNVTNRLVAVDKGFSQASTPVTATGTSCSTATKFGIGTTSNTNITSLDYVYDVGVSEALNATINTCYKASFVLAHTSGSSTTFGPLYMNSTVSISTAFTIDCKYDIGASTPSSPYSFQLTIQVGP